jgi:hypothetical protein
MKGGTNQGRIVHERWAHGPPHGVYLQVVEAGPEKRLTHQVAIADAQLLHQSKDLALGDPGVGSWWSLLRPARLVSSQGGRAPGAKELLRSTGV